MEDPNLGPMLILPPDFEGPALIGQPEAQLKLMTALAAAQLLFGPVHKDRTGQYGYQKFKYSPLAAYTAATERPLAEQGITVKQFFTSKKADPQVRQTTWIMGHGAMIAWSRWFTPATPSKDGKTEPLKEEGKEQTYRERYAYKAAFALDGDPDADEAPLAEDRDPPPRREAPVPAKPSNPPAASKAPAKAPSQPSKAAAAPAAPATSPAPAPASEPVVDREDTAADQDSLKMVHTLREELGWSRIQFSKHCQDVWKIVPGALPGSMRLTQQVIELLQGAILDRQAEADAKGDMKGTAPAKPTAQKGAA